MKSSVFLACGLLCAALAAGTAPFVFVGLLALLLVPSALLLLIAAAVVAAPKGDWSLRHTGGMALSVLGALSLAAAVTVAGTAEYDWQSDRLHPAGETTQNVATPLLAIALSTVGSLGTALGLRFVSAAEWRHAVAWGIGALCVLPAGFVLFLLLSSRFPIGV